ncbi:hypothetical protein TNCV_2211 [Trichonephila clavipes]|nr:hypothetical protein TNCV_2211 [Trichonephila clavipes]
MTHPQNRSGSIYVWSGIFLVVRTNLHTFSFENVDTHSYRVDTLDAYVCPYARAFGDAFVLQDDSTRSHRARIAHVHLKQEKIHRMQLTVRHRALILSE